MLQVCEAVASMHAQGIIHRDLKPSNFFLTRASDGAAHVKVLDFGISKAIEPDPATDPKLTETQAVFGSPTYMSPEQIRSAKHVDARSDVFSLAMSLYHALSGAPAFVYAKSFMKLVLEITSREAPALEDTAPWVPAQIVRVVHGGLLRDPNVRCPSVAEFALALDSACGIDATRREITLSMLGPGPGSALEERSSKPSKERRIELPLEWSDVLRA
jgi:serine/threonine-protein kinase